MGGTHPTGMLSCFSMKLLDKPKLSFDRQFMDAEAQIIGFTEENIAAYVEKFLGEKHKGLKKELVDAAKRKGLYSILRIPIILQMVCILYVDDKTLPTTKTGVVQAIINKYENYF